MTEIDTVRLRVAGRVQGVGFRPFVYRLAQSHRLNGRVRNLTGTVEIDLQGPTEEIGAFCDELLSRSPPLARPHLQSQQVLAVEAFADFHIERSEGGARSDIRVPPDYFLCDDCLRELFDPSNRRHRYPFINCTQCGPRYTLIDSLPYDRPNTSMAGFELCADCAQEYGDPGDRRFHAEPVACAVCGPVLTFATGSDQRVDNEVALAAAVAALREGLVVAVKGVGGYHLMCDARDEQAVLRLRERKHRPDKPLAVIFPQRGADGLSAVREVLHPTEGEAAMLLDHARPIVLVAKRRDAELAPAVAPGLAEVGALLPYSPLHHLLLHDFGGPLVATSGNLSGEPVLTDRDEAARRLSTVADAFLHHDRPILRPADDSVYRSIGQRVRPLRLGRGKAPLELSLPGALPQPLLAVGGHLKATVALAWEGRVVVSPHISDLGSVRGQETFVQVIADLQRLYQVRAQHLVCDFHPDYASHRWARQSGLPGTEVQHHHAHASALAGEHPGVGRWLCFSWDGVGLGHDGTLWGGETLLGRPGDWRRQGGLKPFRLPGGDKAGRQPWRSAAALCWQHGIGPSFPVEHLALARTAWEKNINSPISTGAGRIFDAAACLVLGVTHTSFEGQGPMQLEALADQTNDHVALAVDATHIDWAPLLPVLLDASLPAARRAALLHNSLAQALVDQAGLLRDSEGFDTVGLCGGVFQNRRLVDEVLRRAEPLGLDVRLPVRLPCNDGGLSYGQVIEYLGLQETTHV